MQTYLNTVKKLIKNKINVKLTISRVCVLSFMGSLSFGPLMDRRQPLPDQCQKLMLPAAQRQRMKQPDSEYSC